MSIEAGIIGITESDTKTALTNLDADDSQYNRRVFVKTFYAWLEGLSYSFRKSCVENNKTLTTAEKAILSEEEYYVTNYQIKTKQNKYLSFEQSFRLSLRYFFAEVFDDANINFNCSGWQALTDGLKIRNRITHPKDAEHLTISDEELALVMKAMTWSDDLIAELFRMHQDWCRRQHEEIQAKRDVVQANHKRTKFFLAQLRGYQIQYGTVIHLGFIGEGNGVERQAKRTMLYEGKLLDLHHAEDANFDDVVFPVFFSSDYDLGRNGMIPRSPLPIGAD